MGLAIGGLQSGGGSSSGGGAATSLAPGATGADLTLSGAESALRYTATAPAATDAFIVANTGARVHFGPGGTDYAISDGASTVTFAGTLAGGQVNTGNTVASTSAVANFNISSACNDATTSPTIPGTSVIPQNAYTAGDLVFEVRQSDQTSLLQVYQGGGVGFGVRAAFTPTAPTVVAGAGASVTAHNGTTAFVINLGAAAQTGTVTFPTSANGWIIQMTDVTTNASFVLSQTGGTANTATFTCYSRTTGLAINWNASDLARCTAVAF